MPVQPAKLPRIPKLPPTKPAAPPVPVVRVDPHRVCGVHAGWCIVTCPVCDTDGAGFVQEDVHALPPARSTRCAYGHAYRIELEPLLERDASTLLHT